MKRGALVLILVLILIIAVIALIGGFIYMQFTREPSIPDQSLLVLPLAGSLADVETSPVSKVQTIRDIFFHLQRAKIDQRIRGLLLNISWMETGPAAMDEIGLMIKDFRESGKPVHAFLQGGGLKEYLLASFADSITVMPGSDIFLKHYASEALFLRGTLDKLGIKAEFYHLGNYKTGASLYTRTGMTPEHRQSIAALINDITDHTIHTIARNRNLDKKQVRLLIDDLSIDNDTYQKAGLIDSIGYADEILGDNDPPLKRIPFARYAQTSKPSPFQGADKIALVFASGEIQPGDGGGPSMFGNSVLGADSLAARLRSLLRNDSIKAVVLRVDSPGGSATASEVIRREVERLNEEKPVIVSMAGVAASGGYWLSTPARYIVAHPTTVTGSIGVLGGKFINRGFYDKIGVNKEIVEAGPYAGMFSDTRPFTSAERLRFQSLLKRTYKRFVKLVSQGRKLSEDKAEAAAGGRVWSGSSAVRLGLVNESGGLLAALTAAKKIAELPESKPFGLIILPRRQSLLDMLFNMAGVSARENFEISAILERFNRCFPAALMPFQLRFE